MTYLWFSLTLLSWSLPNYYAPEIRNTSESRHDAEAPADSPQSLGDWFEQKVTYVPRYNDWPNVIDPSLQPWPGNVNWQ